MSSEDDDFGPGEHDYIRLTTVGSIDVVIGAIPRIKWNLEILGMEAEATSLGDAYKALHSALDQLRSSEPE